MKRIYSISFLMLVIISTMSSCNQKQQAQRIQQIDSLGAFLNHVGEVVESIDSAQIEKRLVEMSASGAWVFENISDTLDRKSGLQFGDYMRCQKFYGKALQRYVQVKKELKFSETQLATLRLDVKNNLFSDNEFNGYLKTEAISIENLVKASEELQNGYTSANAQFESTKPAVNHLIDSVKSITHSPVPVKHK